MISFVVPECQPISDEFRKRNSNLTFKFRFSFSDYFGKLMRPIFYTLNILLVNNYKETPYFESDIDLARICTKTENVNAGALFWS